MKLKKQRTFDDILSLKLKELEKELSDATKRFLLLSKVAKSYQLVSFYKQRFYDRRQYQLNLTEYFNDLNIKKNKKGTVSDAFSLLHTKVKTIFENDDDQVALTKATYFEESLLLSYASVLKHQVNMPPELYQLLIHQHTNIERDIDRMEYLKKFC